MRHFRIGLACVTMMIVGCAAPPTEDTESGDQAVNAEPTTADSASYFCSTRAPRGENVFQLPLNFRIRRDASGLARTVLKTSDIEREPDVLDAIQPPIEDTIPLVQASARSAVYVLNEENETSTRIELELDSRQAVRGAKLRITGATVDKVIAEYGSQLTSLEYSCSSLPTKTAIRASTTKCVLRPELDGPGPFPLTLSVAVSANGTTTITESKSWTGAPAAGRGIDDPLTWYAEFNGFLGIEKRVAGRTPTPESASESWVAPGDIVVRLSKALMENGAGALGIFTPFGGGYVASYECKPGR